MSDLNTNYNFEFRRPRFNNPTFMSNNIASTLSFYKPKQGQEKILPFKGVGTGNNMDLKNQKNAITGRDRYYSSLSNKNDQLYQSQRELNPQKNIQKMSIQLETSLNNYENINKAEHNSMRPTQSQLTIPKVNKKTSEDYANNLKSYGNNVLQNNSMSQKQINQIRSKQKQLLLSTNPNPQKIQNRSNFSSTRPNAYSSLSKAPFPLITFTQKDIYRKQDHTYNIITYQPKTHDQHIKKYPKLSLEQKDQYFVHKYLNEQKLMKNKITTTEQNRLNKWRGNDTNKMGGRQDQQSRNKRMAGMYTYNKMTKNNEQNNNGKRFNMKLLNHADELNYYS